MEKLAKYCLGKDGKVYRIECEVSGNYLLTYVDGTSGFINVKKDFIVKEANSITLYKDAEGNAIFELGPTIIID